MQVIILATDEQRRLPPLTDQLPGPLVPIVDRPVMATTVEVLARAGYKQILVSLYERGGQIAAYFGGGRRWGVDLKYLTQRQAWGSAGSLRFAAGLLRESVLVLPGDAMIDLDIEAALAFHQAHGGPITAILHPVLPSSNAPLLILNDRGHVLPAGADSGQPYHATGAWILEPGVLAHIPATGVAEICEHLLPAVHATGELVFGYVMEGYWNPLDSIGAFQAAQRVYLYSAYRERAPEQASAGPAEVVRYPSLEARQIAPGIWVGRDHSIHPSAKLAPPTYIGPNSWIGREVELGPDAIIGANVVIDDEATVSASTILSDTYVGRLVRVEGRVVTPGTISDVEAGETTRIVDPFLIGRMGAAAEGRSPLRRALSGATALLLIVVLSPLLLLLALLTTLTTGKGPIVRSPHVGQRIGEGQSPRSFQLLQFRTRRESGAFTPLGALLERLELHRLPELFNVLGGDMALVGVKALRPDEAARLTEEWQQRRHECPAGLTGLWYIQTEQGSDLDTLIVADVYYTATRTWRGDMLILLRTPSAWLRRCRQGPGARGTQDYRIQADHLQSM